MLFEHGFYLTKPIIWALICLHDFTWESVAALTDHFANAFVSENVAGVLVKLGISYDYLLTFWFFLEFFSINIPMEFVISLSIG